MELELKLVWEPHTQLRLTRQFGRANAGVLLALSKSGQRQCAKAFISTVISHNFPQPRIIAKVNINDVDENLVIRVIKNPRRRKKKTKKEIWKEKEAAQKAGQEHINKPSYFWQESRHKRPKLITARKLLACGQNNKATTGGGRSQEGGAGQAKATPFTFESKQSLWHNGDRSRSSK